MRVQLISDNVDTMVGMRFAGVPGIIVHKEDETKKAIEEAIEKEDVAVILITERLVDLCREYIYDLKLNLARPLIVEIPDRHSSGGANNSMTKYIKDAIGIKL